MWRQWQWQKTATKRMTKTATIIAKKQLYDTVSGFMSNWETQVIILMKVTDFDLWFNVHLPKWKFAGCNLLCGNMRSLWNLLVMAPGGIMYAYFPSSKTL